MFSAFSQPVISVRRTVKLLLPIPLWQLFWPDTGRLMISLSSTTSPVLLLSITHIELLRILELRIVTFGAFTTTWPVMSRPSMHGPGGADRQTAARRERRPGRHAGAVASG